MPAIGAGRTPDLFVGEVLETIASETAAFIAENPELGEGLLERIQRDAEAAKSMRRHIGIRFEPNHHDVVYESNKLEAKQAFAEMVIKTVQRSSALADVS